MIILSRPRPSTWGLLLGLLLLSCLYAIWVWTGELTDLGGDSAAYLIISRLYSPYHAASAATLAYKSGIVSPPLFPLLIAIVDGGYHILAAHLLVAGFALASTVATYFWLTREAINHWVAAAIALLFALLPATLLTVFNIWTEFPYLFFSMAAIALLAPSPRETTRAAWFGAAAMVACACLVRVAALPLLAAFLLYLVLCRPRQWALLGIMATLPFAVWALYSNVRETGAGSYVSHFVNVYADDPVGRLIRQCNIEFDAVFRAWKMGWLQYSSSGELHGIVAGFLVLCAAGCLYRLTRLRFDALYALLYAVELFAWPHPEEAPRYSFVLYPILIGSGFLLLAALPERFSKLRGRRYLPALGVGVMALCTFPAISYQFHLFAEPIPAEVEAARHTRDWYLNTRYDALRNAYFFHRLFNHLTEIDSFVAPGQCVFTTKPPLVTLLADRIGTSPPRIGDSDAAFDAGIRECRFAYALPFPTPSYPEALYPMHRLGERGIIVSRAAGGTDDSAGTLIEIKP